jgi:hypothetical protein
MSYILLRGRWCDINFRNVLAPTYDKIDDMKDSFYEELENEDTVRFQCQRHFQTKNWE